MPLISLSTTNSWKGSIQYSPSQNTSPTSHKSQRKGWLLHLVTRGQSLATVGEISLQLVTKIEELGLFFPEVIYLKYAYLLHMIMTVHTFTGKMTLRQKNFKINNQVW